MPYLLDSCILIDYSRGHQGAVTFVESIENTPDVSVLTMTEILSGVRNQREERLFDRLFSVMGLIPVNAEIATLASDYLRQYRGSHQLDPFDAIIAASATSQGLELVTLNLIHFPMMDGIKRPYTD